MRHGRLLLAGLIVAGWEQLAVATEYEAPTQAAPQQKRSASPMHKEFYVLTVHIDGKTNISGDATHPPEAFPSQTLPEGGGLIMKEPDKEGNWQVRSFIFQPSQLVVRQGDTVTLHFVGVQGASHTITVEGHPDPLVLKRGEMKTVTIVADKVGTIAFFAVDRQPTMQGTILVLPKG
jgi:plastocyanin